jgi:hypothetical protein
MDSIKYSLQVGDLVMVKEAKNKFNATIYNKIGVVAYSSNPHNAYTINLFGDYPFGYITTKRENLVLLNKEEYPEYYV